MGGLPIIVWTELRDAYKQLGTCVYMAKATTGYTRRYHARNARRWLKVIDDIRPFVFTEKMTEQRFREAVYKHFEDRVIFSVQCMHGILTVPPGSARAKQLQKATERAVKQWLVHGVTPKWAVAVQREKQ